MTIELLKLFFPIVLYYCLYGINIKVISSLNYKNCHLPIILPVCSRISGGDLHSAGLGHRMQEIPDGRIIITDVQGSDAGNYTCSTDNAHGTDAIVYQLIVQGECGANAIVYQLIVHGECGANAIEYQLIVQGECGNNEIVYQLIVQGECGTNAILCQLIVQGECGTNAIVYQLIVQGECGIDAIVYQLMVQGECGTNAIVNQLIVQTEMRLLGESQIMIDLLITRCIFQSSKSYFPQYMLGRNTRGLR